MTGRSAIAVPVRGLFRDAVGGTGTFTGTFTIQRFVREDDRIVASGTMTGTLVDSLGHPAAGPVLKEMVLPFDIAAAKGARETPNLELGRLHLDLSELQVELSKVVLDLTVKPGAGSCRTEG